MFVRSDHPSKDSEIPSRSFKTLLMRVSKTSTKSGRSVPFKMRDVIGKYSSVGIDKKIFRYVSVSRVLNDMFCFTIKRPWSICEVAMPSFVLDGKYEEMIASFLTGGAMECFWRNEVS